MTFITIGVLVIVYALVPNCVLEDELMYVGHSHLIPVSSVGRVRSFVFVSVVKVR